MYRLLAVVVAALAGAAIWRRREIRSDAERASTAIAGAANSARSRIRSGHGESGEGDGDEVAEDLGDGEVAETGVGEAVEQPDTADSVSSTS